jgi:hypothetical protein
VRERSTAAVERQSVGVQEIIATFSEHLAKNYPPPKDFRRNFDLLLRGKRDRGAKGEYAASLEKNIVFLGELVAGAEALVERLLGRADDAEEAGAGIAATLEKMEERAHEHTSRRHREAFVDGMSDEFAELRGERAAGESAYLDKLEFNYRYLMTLRIFLFEFLSVLAAIREEHAVAGAAVESARAVRRNIELTAHYYLGNVAVGAVEGEGPSGGGPS